MKPTMLFLALVSFSLLQAGCAVIDAGNDMARYSWNAMKPRATDYKDPFADDGAEWESVGRDGRGERTKEYDVDRWWKKYISSPKANSIERNVGIY